MAFRCGAFISMMLVGLSFIKAHGFDLLSDYIVLDEKKISRGADSAANSRVANNSAGKIYSISQSYHNKHRDTEEYTLRAELNRDVDDVLNEGAAFKFKRVTDQLIVRGQRKVSTRVYDKYGQPKYYTHCVSGTGNWGCATVNNDLCQRLNTQVKSGRLSKAKLENCASLEYSMNQAFAVRTKNFDKIRKKEHRHLKKFFKTYSGGAGPVVDYNSKFTSQGGTTFADMAKGLHVMIEACGKMGVPFFGDVKNEAGKYSPYYKPQNGSGGDGVK